MSTDEENQGGRAERLAELFSTVRTLSRDVEELNRQQKALWDRFDGREGVTRDIESIKLEEVKSNASMDSKFTEKIAMLEKSVEAVKREELARDFRQRMMIAQLAWKVSIVIGAALFVINLLTKNLDIKELFFGSDQHVVRKTK